MNPQLQFMLQEAYQTFQIGNLTKAHEILESCLKIGPQNFDVLHLLAVVCASQSKHHEALAYYKAAAVIKPRNESVLSNWGASLNAVGQNEEALAVFKKALEISPDASEIWYNAANTLCDLDRCEDALFYYTKSIEFDHRNFQAYGNYGKALFDLRRYSESLPYFDNALLINPSFLDSLINKGEALRALNRFDEAITCYDKALSLQPNYHQAWSNKGVTLHDLDRFDEAIACYDKSLSLQPNYYQAWSNKGMAFHEIGRYEEAVACYDKALSLQSGYHEASWNKSLSLLLQGNFKEGFSLYESRWHSKKASEIVGKRDFQEPAWLGVEALNGKTILLYGEQGLGDFIQFCRYVKLVANLGATVILEAPKPLASLLRNLEGVSQLVVRGENLPAFDYQCPLLSLPLALETVISSVPADIPYLAVPQNKVTEWSYKLGVKKKKRVGLVWSSMSKFADDSKRSLSLVEFCKALPSDGYEYICLQKELKDCDKKFFEDYKNIKFFGDELVDFSDTAALIQNLDLVISTCTSVPHLSGALGKATWILLSYTPDWRWLLGGKISPWYPSMKLYRQEALGDWGNILNEVKADLERG